MTLKHYTNFHQSEVMRELERIAVRKGHFDPTPEEEVESAVAQIKTASAESFELTGDLFNDVMRLAAGMRAKGFEKQAYDLEHKVLLYKVAERHLYRVFDEDGDDLLDHAHPEGEFDVAPAQGENGKVETTLTKHKRIMDVVRSAPTGKLASIANEIVRTAQLTLSEEQREKNQKKLDDLVSSLKIELVRIRDWVKKNFPNQAGAGDKIDAVAKTLGVTLGLDDSKYVEAIKQIRESSGKVKSVLAEIRRPADVSGAIAFGQVPTAANNYEMLVESFSKEIGKMIPGRIGKDVKQQDRAIDKPKIEKALASYNWSLKAWDHALRSYQDADKKDDASKALKNVEALRNVANILSAVLKGDNTMLQLQQAISPFVSVMDEDGILNDAYQTQRDTQSMLSKLLQTSHSAQISKKGIGLEQPSSALPPAPPIPESGKPTQPAPAGKTPAKPSAPVKPSIPEAELQAVRVMQNLLTDLSNGLTKESESVSKRLKMSVQEVVVVAQTIADTGLKGVPSATAADGVWGPKTQKALRAVNSLTGRAGVPNVDVGQTYREMDTPTTIEKAQANSKILSQLMVKLELPQRGVPEADVTGPLDAVPKLLSGDVLEGGKIPLYEENVTTLGDFWSFMMTQNLLIAPKTASKKEYLEKIALEVVGQHGAGTDWEASKLDPNYLLRDKPMKGPPPDWVHRSSPAWQKWYAQQQSLDQPKAPAANTQAPAKTPTPQVGQTAPALSYVTAGEFDAALQWFAQRAGQLARTAKTPQEANRMRAYYAAMQRLFLEWRRLVAKQNATGDKLYSNTQVTQETLGEMGARTRPAAGRSAGRPSAGPGAGMRRGPGREGYDIGGMTSEDIALSEPPFTDRSRRPRKYINLQFLEEAYQPNRQLADRLAMTRLSQLSLRSPEDFAAAYASDEKRKIWARERATTGTSENFNRWIHAVTDYLSRELGEIFSAWADRLETGVRATRDPNIENLIGSNLDQLRTWQGWLARLARMSASGRYEQTL